MKRLVIRISSSRRSPEKTEPPRYGANIDCVFSETEKPIKSSWAQ